LSCRDWLRSMTLNSDIKIEKVPALTCKKCGSFRVMIGKDGPECSDCDTKDGDTFVELCRQVEYTIYQFSEEMEKNETF